MVVTVPEDRRPQTYSIWVEDANGHALQWRGLPKVAIAETYEFVRHRYAT